MFELIPFSRDSRNIFKQYDDLEKEFFGNMNTSISVFRTDIIEKDDKFILQAELPGFNREDINIDIKDGLLTINAQHTQQDEIKENHYVRRERKFGSFTRRFDVTGINEERISASYKDGILELELPKAAQVVNEAKKIEIF